jgi:uncharacterized membrane protein
MFQPTFLDTALNARTNVAILFFSLAIMAHFNDKIDAMKKRILFIIFMASCILSHYSTSYIFFYIMLATFLVSVAMSRKYVFKKGINLTIIILFFVIIFLWYSQLTEKPFIAGIIFIEEMLINLNRFFILEARSEHVRAMFGVDLSLRTTPARIRFVFSWLTLAFIVAGIITSLLKRKEMTLLNPELEKPDFLKNKFEVEYFVIALICAGICGIMVALPYVSPSYSLERVYSMILTILSVFFLIGGLTISKYIKNIIKIFDNNRKLEISVILMVLIPFYLCISGVIYNVFGVPAHITLNSEGELYNNLYISDAESHSAKWLGRYADEQRKIYFDSLRPNILISQSDNPLFILPGKYSDLQNYGGSSGYIFLDRYNVVNGTLRNGQNLNAFYIGNMVYNNGDSEILMIP